MAAYYNEIDPAAAHLLECLIKEGIIADGIVDRRSIVEVQPDDIKEFTQCHFFAGGGLWSIALRLAGWSDDRPVWTGSCPCQPFSVAGKGAGKNDKRHLWPDFFRLINACRPTVVMGEQVAGQSGYDWFDGVASDLEGSDYQARAVDIPALAVGAAHIRQRLYWISVANTNSIRRDGIGISEHAGIKSSCGCKPFGHGENGRIYGQGNVANTDSARWREQGAGGNIDDGQIAERKEAASDYGISGPWDDSEWQIGIDGKARRVKSGICVLADGFPGRVHLLRIAGNAIVPQVAAEIIKSLMMSDIFFVETDCHCGESTANVFY